MAGVRTGRSGFGLDPDWDVPVRLVAPSELLAGCNGAAVTPERLACTGCRAAQWSNRVEIF